MGTEERDLTEHLTWCPVPGCPHAIVYPRAAQAGADLALAEHLRDEHVVTGSVPSETPLEDRG